MRILNRRATLAFLVFLIALGCILLTTSTASAEENPGLYGESLRPQFHFTAKKNWLNDPNGMVYVDGVYHLFFQYEFAHRNWGHATSPDMIHWTEGPVALRPDEMGDMWSGSGVLDADNTSGFGDGKTKPIVLMYTAAGGMNPQSAGKKFTQCLAYSADGGKTWKKYEHNPVIQHIRGGNRDPRVVWDPTSKQWIVVFYLDGDDFAFYTSPDLKNWKHLQDIRVRGCGECPDFYPLPIENEPGKSAWVWSNANGKYLVGEFDGKEFKPEHGFDAIQSEFGRNFYAGQTFSNMPDQRRVEIAWMWNAIYPGMPFDQQMSFPTQLTLHRTPDGLRLRRVPIEEIKTLRDKSATRSGVPLTPAGESLKEISGECLDINAVVEIGSARRVGLRVAGQSIDFDPAVNKLSILSTNAPVAPVNGRITLRVLVDRTSIEVFANDGVVSLTNFVIPDPRTATLPPNVFADGGDGAKLISCEAYTLKSAWEGQR